MKEPLKVVSIADEALDTKAMDAAIGKGLDGWTEYIRNRDPSTVRAKPGQKLVWFAINPIPTSLFSRHVQTAASDPERYVRAFQCGVSEIRNAPDGHGGHTTLRPTEKTHTATGHRLMWTDEDMDAFPPVWLEEIGSVVWCASFLARTTAGTFQPPPSLVLALVERQVRDAAEELEDERRNSVERSRQREANLHGSDSAADSAAPATG